MKDNFIFFYENIYFDFIEIFGIIVLEIESGW